MKMATWIGLATGVAWAVGLALHHGTVGLVIGLVAGVVLGMAFRREEDADNA
ncbi:MAG: hypothetical protein Q8W51_07650 [Candidatus Palauibacterales bacterium]|nr:hypothetical protein [Candidatus Palauibacterales bacterium]MDP2529596.1 hypothetical protein [Candidatus Palauibacterales bacterium]MDP2582615.1 hypothetical protein [Candidatus Palauibacterales bacterium]